MSGEISEGAWVPARGHGQAPQATVEALGIALDRITAEDER